MHRQFFLFGPYHWDTVLIDKHGKGLNFRPFANPKVNWSLCTGVRLHPRLRRLHPRSGSGAELQPCTITQGYLKGNTDFQISAPEIRDLRSAGTFNLNTPLMSAESWLKENADTA